MRWRESGLRMLAAVTSAALVAHQVVIHFSRGVKETREMASATIRHHHGNMTIGLAGDRITVMAADTGSHYILMINPDNRIEGGRGVTTLALHGCADMVHRLPQCIDVVVAGDALASQVVVIKAHRLPAKVRVTVGTLIVRGNVMGGFAGDNNIVVAILATAKYFMVVNHRYSLPTHSAMTGVATLAGKNVLNGFRRGIEAAIDTVAGDALRGRAGELAADMAAFAGHEVVATGQLKAGCRVIKGFILCLHKPAETPHQRH